MHLFVEKNQMEVKIITIPPKILIGKYLSMSLAHNKTQELWRDFMPRRKEIANKLNNDLISMQVYNETQNFNDFNPESRFEKWAAIEVSNYTEVPDDLKIFTLTGGLYAVFLYKGSSNKGAKAFEYIFTEWLPNSNYLIDKRPHFEVLGEKYKNDDPDSEEEIWIPIKLKNHLII